MFDGDRFARASLSQAWQVSVHFFFAADVKVTSTVSVHWIGFCNTMVEVW